MIYEGWGSHHFYGLPALLQSTLRYDRKNRPTKGSRDRGRTGSKKTRGGLMKVEGRWVGGWFNRRFISNP